MNKRFLADLHMHSTFSDGKLTIPELVDFYGSRGFGAIAITDHLCETQTLLGLAAARLGRTLTSENFPEYLAVLKKETTRAWTEYGMVLIPGVELTKNSISNHRSAHVIGLGISSYISPDMDVLQIAKALREQGAISIAAHPVATRKVEKQTFHLWDRREELAPHFDAWEVAAGRVIFSEVMESGLPMVASSDLHAPWQIESWKTVFYCVRSQAAILEAIRTQDLRFEFYFDAERASSPAISL